MSGEMWWWPVTQCLKAALAVRGTNLIISENNSSLLACFNEWHETINIIIIALSKRSHRINSNMFNWLASRCSSCSSRTPQFKTIFLFVQHLCRTYSVSLFLHELSHTLYLNAQCGFRLNYKRKMCAW